MPTRWEAFAEFADDDFARGEAARLEKLRAHLGEESGSRPSRELVALKENVVAQEPDLDWAPAAAAPFTSRVR
jgi:hypothetical protein